ncbi:LOW QUALITY PROTEIN: maltase-glucoamylase, intestinal-like, partial [Camarhynchus parvulus]|uniref:LOW QUALITY PROTEIN: maltase-glucoamylase, intestinal-like n=1 Tax=Geospiza parvula TaxID=87175 RepID=UPI00123823F0
RRNPLGLIVALDENQEASGELFWDDGESAGTVESKSYIFYEFRFSNNVLELSVTHNNYSDPHGLEFREVRVLGLPREPIGVSVTSDGAAAPANHSLSYDGAAQETTSAERVPYCHYGGPENGYGASDIRYGDTGATATVTRARSAHSSSSSAHPRGMEPIERLRLEVTYHSDHLLQFKISDPSSRRYEVPVPLALPATPLATPRSRLYDVEIQDWPFGIRVRRRSSGAVIWDSQLPTFTFAEQFLQISTRLPSPFVYGFGENEHGTFRHDLNWHTWGMFARDQPPGYKLNSYGFQPFYMALEEDVSAHGVLLLNSNAMDVTFQPTPALTFRATGVPGNFRYWANGPEAGVQEYTELIGRPMLPPYWSLGFQLCRYGYRDAAEIARLVHDMSQAQIPLDVQYADIDYMERQLDFTLRPQFQNLPQLVRDIRSRGMRFVLILDPAISANETNYLPYERGLQQDVFIKWPNSDEIIFAKVWPDLPNVVVNDSLDWDTQVELFRAFTAVPDFFRNSTRDWWAREIAEVFENPRNSSLSIKFDGIWIDMNEPSNFVHGAVGGCRDRDLNFPPYMPQLGSRWEGLSFKTLHGEQRLPAGGGCAAPPRPQPVRHYDVHNLYGWAQTEPTLRALQELTGERGIVVTRSTFPGSGRWAGHWLGDNTAAWDQMGKSIVGMLDFSLFGVSYTGADICGFFGEPSPLPPAAGWRSLGTFYPTSNHNGNLGTRQDPVAWNSTFASLSRRALRLRYRLLPLLYSLLFCARARGSTVVRPLLHEFTEDRTTWDIDRQFLWGEGLLVSPALEPGVTEVRAYLPDARWFDFHTDEEVGFRRQFRNFPAPLGRINLHIRGGLVLPQQLPANNTWFSRRNPMLLTVALNDSQEASGSLYWDDGVGIDTYEKGEYLLMAFTARSDPNLLKFTKIKISGSHDSGPVPCSLAIEHDPQKKVLRITQLELELGRNYTLKWG